MKNLQVSFKQDNLTIYAIKTEVSEDSVNLFVGSALNQLFRFVNVAKNVGAKTFCYSNPINLVIEVEGKTFDTSTVDEALQAKLKLQRNTKGMKRFAQRVFSLVMFSVGPIEQMSFNDLLLSFED